MQLAAEGSLPAPRPPKGRVSGGVPFAGEAAGHLPAYPLRCCANVEQSIARRPCIAIPPSHRQQAAGHHTIQMPGAVLLFRGAKRHEQQQQLFIGGMMLHGMGCPDMIVAERIQIPGFDCLRHPRAEFCHPVWCGSTQREWQWPIPNARRSSGWRMVWASARPIFAMQHRCRPAPAARRVRHVKRIGRAISCCKCRHGKAGN